MTMKAAFLTLCLAALAGAGCVSQTTHQSSAAQQEPVARRLSLDPTDEYELAAWWTNGSELLHLDEDRTYQLYEGTNRYHEPAEHGAWWRQSYATLWLEPYDERPQEAARVAIRRAGGELRLDVRDLAPMSQLPDPPQVIEDRLIGGWQGDAGTLLLGADLRYRFERSPKADGLARLGTEDGAWHVEEHLLILEPNSAARPPTLLRIREDGDEPLHLQSSAGALYRMPSPIDHG